MYLVELDQSKRLLVISAAQRITAEQAKQTAQRVRELLQKCCAWISCAGGFSMVGRNGFQCRTSRR